MDEMLICIHHTDFGSFFENTGSNAVFLLSEEFAEATWNCEIHHGSSSYFDLPDDSWIVASRSVPIGRWIEAYNNNQNDLVEKVLRTAVKWPDDRVINFFAKKKIVFRSKWYHFLRYWDEFIAAEDDCPIVIPKGGARKEAILFRPIGDIVKIAR